MIFTKWHKLFIGIFILLVLGYLFLAWIIGFPWERAQAKNAISKYMYDKYKLTATDIPISFAPDGMNIVSVDTKELPFSVRVFINRDDMQVWHDLYLESLVEYHLEKFIRKKATSLSDDDRMFVVLENRFPKDSDLTIEKVNCNPNIIFERPEIEYYCSIEGVEESRRALISEEINKNFKPSEILFN